MPHSAESETTEPLLSHTPNSPANGGEPAAGAPISSDPDPDCANQQGGTEQLSHTIGKQEQSGTMSTQHSGTGLKTKKFLGFTNYIPSRIKVDYGLPSTVVSVRDGWQWTCQSGAVVSGLLASVAAQLLTLFKTPPQPGEKIPPEGAQTFLLFACYAAIFFNINATISSFILIDKLGELGFKASSKQPRYDPDYDPAISDPEGKLDETPVGTPLKTQEQLMMDYGASKRWRQMLFYWLITFYLGIVLLVAAIFTYVVMQENLPIKISLGVTILVNALFLLYFNIANVIARD